VQKIAILGAGRSAGYLIDHLALVSKAKSWELKVYDQDFEGYFSSFGENVNCIFEQSNLADLKILESIVKYSDLVISVLPPSMHFGVARFCVLHGTHLVTASYISPEMKALHDVAVENNIVLLNELGLDPGIDHLSAAKAIFEIQEKGGDIFGFESYCGGLITENDCQGNPWKYKFTWNPRNVVLAGQGGKSKWIANGELHQIAPFEVFKHIKRFDFPGLGEIEAYPNRDSLSYIDQYHLSGVKTMLRGTLRRIGFSQAWQVLVDAGFTNDEKGQDLVFENRRFWFEFITKCKSVQDWLAKINVNDVDVVEKMIYLDLDNENTLPLENLSHAAHLQNILQEKWKLHESDKDEVLMVHKIDYMVNNNHFKYAATMRIIGEGGAHTAMAKTVGLPLALGAIAILDGSIKERGCLMPFNVIWGKQILLKLEELGIQFTETIQQIND
jgi:saccharopine dehydrogenase-like NADP-dependent oxidoreductase